MRHEAISRLALARHGKKPSLYLRLLYLMLRWLFWLRDTASRWAGRVNMEMSSRTIEERKR